LGKQFVYVADIGLALFSERMNQVVIANEPKGFKSVAQSNFLSFFVSSPVVRDRYFVRSCLGFTDHRGDLDLHTEASASQRHRLYDLFTKRLVTRLDV